MTTRPLDRPSARVILIDGTGSVLLFRIEDPHDAKPPLWITPGGGVRPGEVLRDDPEIRRLYLGG